mgnify:CR=1 FL=1
MMVDFNIAIGQASGLTMTGGASNVMIGHDAMAAANGSNVNNCVAIGDAALSAAATHATEIAIGEDAMVAWTGAGTGTGTGAGAGAGMISGSGLGAAFFSLASNNAPSAGTCNLSP